MNPLPTTSYAVLGLLTIGPMSRYDLVAFAEASIAHFWTIAKSQIYGELSRLEDLGYVKGTDVKQSGLPDKRIYEVTPEGLEALDAWLAEPGFEPDRFRSGVLVKLFFASRMPEERLTEMIAAYRSRLEEHTDYHQRIVDGLEQSPGAQYMRATALLGLRIHETVLAWANELLRTLESSPTKTSSKKRRSR